MAQLTNRKYKRAKALAKQIYDAGYFVPCSCGLMGCFYRATPKSRAESSPFGGIPRNWKQYLNLVFLILLLVKFPLRGDP
jgi:hypothetical protein